MSRQIQLRRGTSAEHETFTGAIGEVTVDTTNNTLRVHDGEIPGGTTLAKRSEIPDLTPFDYVTEWQSPTADNNYTWYRKYKSGWVEQGGESTGGTIILPIQMLNTHYTVTSGLYYSSGSSWTVGSIRPRDVTSISLNKANADKGWWHVCGIAA